MLSIIIPTLNEEKYLPLLLDSIKKQRFSDYEIIVADASSKDKTVEIAKSHNCQITSGGLPAKGKNEGARAAKGDTLLFLDADSRLPENFLKRGMEEFKKRRLQISTCRLVLGEEKKINYLLSHIFYNIPILMMEKILPHAATAILIEKELFNKLNGFDEDIKLAEDHDLARRAKKIFNPRYGILRSVKVFVSDRRFKNDGWFKTAAKYFFCEFHITFLGPAKSNVFKYKFNHYKKS